MLVWFCFQDSCDVKEVTFERGRALGIWISREGLDEAVTYAI